MEELASAKRARHLAKLVPDDHLRLAATDLFEAAAAACESGDLSPLAQTLADWESTIELLSDLDFVADVRVGGT